MLGAEAAGRLGIEDPSGDPQLWIGARWFTVTGVLDPIPLAPEIDRAALIGRPAAKQLAVKKDGEWAPGPTWFGDDALPPNESVELACQAEAFDGRKG
ncbi:hypothetical protein [Actinoplanes sp. CA-252034]|uniref:hypothetical protein n=1 Tax=Actinoplanes sp. CA-252034 TaxID=3239906 RepID=UPI003D96D1CE